MRDSAVSPAGGGDTILPPHHRLDVKTTTGSRAADQLHQVDHQESAENQPQSAETQPQSAASLLLHLKHGASGSAADTQVQALKILLQLAFDSGVGGVRRGWQFKDRQGWELEISQKVVLEREAVSVCRAEGRLRSF